MSSLVIEAANYIGAASINSAASNDLVLPDIFSSKRLPAAQGRFRHGGLYQGIAQGLIKGVHTKQTLRDFVTSVAWAADQVYATRQYDRIGTLSHLLLSLPLSPQVESVGRYYEALSINRSGRGDTGRAGAIFEEVADRAPIQYRARAMLALGANRVNVGDHENALPWYKEILRIATSDRAVEPVTLYWAENMIAVVKATTGDHQGALSHLEAIFPMVRMASHEAPSAYYTYMNSLAVELAEVGRIEEAARASKIACSSLFAPAYPEWHETFHDVALKRRRASHSTIAVSDFIIEPAERPSRRLETLSKPALSGRENECADARTELRAAQTGRRQWYKTHKVVSLPARQPAANAEMGYDPAQGSPARVLDFQQWKRRVEPNPQLSALSPEQKTEMTTGDKLIRLMDLISHDDTDDEMIDVILEAVETIVLGRRGAS